MGFALVCCAFLYWYFLEIEQTTNLLICIIVLQLSRVISADVSVAAHLIMQVSRHDHNKYISESQSYPPVYSKSCRCAIVARFFTNTRNQFGHCKYTTAFR